MLWHWDSGRTRRKGREQYHVQNEVGKPEEGVGDRFNLIFAKIEYLIDEPQRIENARSLKRVIRHKEGSG